MTQASFNFDFSDQDHLRTFFMSFYKSDRVLKMYRSDLNYYTQKLQRSQSLQTLLWSLRDDLGAVKLKLTKNCPCFQQNQSS